MNAAATADDEVNNEKSSESETVEVWMSKFTARR